MGLLQKLKSVLGLDGARQSATGAEPDVTVEREPSAESERAVKGGGSARESGADTPRAPQSATSAGESEAASGTRDDRDAAGAPSSSDSGTSAAEKIEAAAGDSSADEDPGTDSGTADAGPGPSGDEVGDAAEDSAEAAASDEIGSDDAGSDETDSDERATVEEPADATPSAALEEINGIGPTYADRLEKADIADVGDLAGSDPETVADAAQTSPSRAEDWIAQAEEF